MNDWTKAPTITLVVAVSENGVIGRDGGLPWRLSSDLMRFKADTLGKPIIMGRKTFQSIGKPLPGRDNIVISRDAAFRQEGVTVVQSVEAAIAAARLSAKYSGATDIAVIGGGEIYRQTIDMADRIILTQVLATVDGDTLFPDLNGDIWTETASVSFPTGEKDSHKTRRIVLERRSVSQ